MITIALIVLAAIFNSVMDCIENEHFYSSVFKDFNERFWYKRISWRYAKMIGGYRLDAWHLCKSAMIINMCIAIVTYHVIIMPLVDLIILGIVWNLTFNFFYKSWTK